MAYIFDTNIFIRSKHEMPMDLWPTFWTKNTYISGKHKKIRFFYFNYIR